MKDLSKKELKEIGGGVVWYLTWYGAVAIGVIGNAVYDHITHFGAGFGAGFESNEKK